MNLPQLPPLSARRECFATGCRNSGRRRVEHEVDGNRVVYFLCEPHYEEQATLPRWPFEDVA